MTWFFCAFGVLLLALKTTKSVQNTKFESGDDFNGTLTMSESSTLAVYVLEDTSGDVPLLYDTSRTTGVDAVEGDTAYFEISLKEAWVIRRILFTCTSNDQYIDSSLSHIDFMDLNDNGNDVEIPSDEYVVDSDFDSGDEFYRFEWVATGEDVRNGDRTEMYTDTFEITIKFTQALNSGAEVTTLLIEGVQPTSAPTTMPTVAPTTGAPTPPSPSPTSQPTNQPSVLPTFSPTNAPTIEGYYQLTPRNTSYSTQSNFTWSDNVYPLAYRNQTYRTFTVPGNEPLCATCILAWANIDALIKYVGDCPVDDNGELDFGIVDGNGVIMETGSFYFCNGTWVIETSANLVSFQQTYGRLEIWEVDDFGRKYQVEFFEFQWNTSKCEWGGNGEPCDVLPLTHKVKDAAMFRWTMPKLPKDNRDRPLIIVWYDLLSVPYSLRPSLFDEWWNLEFDKIEEGQNLGLKQVVNEFQVAFWAAGFLMFGFVFIMMVACLFADEAILKQDYMLDTRDIRTTYIHSVTTLIAPQSELKTRSKFSMKRHGLWLGLVLAFRLVYMFVFTFFFFLLMFETINQRSFHILEKEYKPFAHQRDSQLLNMSSVVEEYYYNETDRMEAEVEKRNYYCYVVYINETAAVYEEGLVEQYLNHSRQMNNSLSRLNFNNISAGLYVSGNTACNINEDDGAVIYSRDPYEKLIFDSNGDYENTTYLYAYLYNRSVNTGRYNFSYFEQYMVSICEETDDCNGWTWIDPYFDNGTSYSASYYFLSEGGDPINSDLSGICYAMSEFDPSLYDFSGVNALANYSNYLENLYLENYQVEVEGMFDTLTNMYDSIKELFVAAEDSEDHSFDVIIDNEATDYDMQVNLHDYYYGSGKNTSLDFWTEWKIVVSCPGCPDGNFSNVYLEELARFLYAYNYTNISQFVDDVTGSSNFSDYVSYDTAWLDYPDVPEIELPFSIKFPDLGIWGLIRSITITLDIILLVYRWYKTAGIIAGIVRGKDVEIQLKYLQTEVAPPRPCCDGQKMLDKCLNCILWWYDGMKNCSYNVWRFMYWIWTMMFLTIIVLFILMAYILVDAMITVKFFTDLGAFDLLTVGLATQRSIRNEVICTTALSYNNYTLTLLDDSRTTYADLKNEDAWEQNVDELERVNDYNAYFCDAYTAYHASERDIIRDCGCVLADSVSTNVTISGFDESIKLAFDDDITTFFGYNYSIAGNTDMFVEIKLPAIDMTQSRDCYWEIVQLVFDWRWYENGQAAQDGVSSIEYEVYTKYNESKGFELQDLETNVYQVPDKDTESDIQENNVQWEDIVVKYILVKFRNIDTWEGSLYLNELSFIGTADEDCIGCDTVTFYFWDFNAYEVYVLLCPDVTPIHGIMYRGFVRRWLTQQLKTAHKPFIRAVRNIALSPFAILLVGSIILVLVYLIAFMVQWVLLKVNLYRENPFAKVPLVHAKNSEFYDPSMHDVDDAMKHADVTTYYGNSGTVVNDSNGNVLGNTDGGQTGQTTSNYSYGGDGDHVTGGNVEMGIQAEADGLHHTLRNKPRPPAPPPGMSGGGLPVMRSIEDESTGPVVASDAQEDRHSQEVHDFLKDMARKQDSGATVETDSNGGYGYSQQ